MGLHLTLQAARLFQPCQSTPFEPLPGVGTWAYVFIGLWPAGNNGFAGVDGINRSCSVFAWGASNLPDYLGDCHENVCRRKCRIDGDDCRACNGGRHAGEGFVGARGKSI